MRHEKHVSGARRIGSDEDAVRGLPGRRCRGDRAHGRELGTQRAGRRGGEDDARPSGADVAATHQERGHAYFDLGVGPYRPAPVLGPVPVFTWIGCYLGGIPAAGR